MENAILCGASPVHDEGSDKSIDGDDHHIDHKDRSSTVTVDNSHYIVAASGI